MKTQSALSALGVALAFIVTAATAQAQDAEITGQVTDEDGQALSGVMVQLEGTGYTAVTDDQGEYGIDVSPGTYNVAASMLGFADARETNVSVGAGETANIDLVLRGQALALEEVRVTGVTDPVEGIASPISVARVSSADMPVPQANPAQALQGRVAGARVRSTSGQPGGNMQIRLGARLGVNTSDSPLVVIDGVVQGSTLRDIDPRDIESMEVVRGAAAAAAYGSRAQAGVVEIQTRRGSEIDVGSTRFNVRSEFGTNQIPSIPRSADRHPYRVDDEQNPTTYLDGDGNPVGYQDAALREDRMLMSPYVEPTYDPFEQIISGGQHLENTVRISQNAEETNYYFSAGHYNETGIIPDFNEGYERQNVRLNVDHNVTQDLLFSVSAYHMRSARDAMENNPFWHFRFMPWHVNPLETDDDGDYIIRADPGMVELNPLYEMSTRESWNYRRRTQGATQLDYRPRSWLTFEGQANFDRSDRESEHYWPHGFKSLSPDPINEGRFYRSYNYTQTIEGNLGARLHRTFLGDDLSTTMRFRYNLQREDLEEMNADGRQFTSEGVRSLDAVQDERIGGDSEEIRTESVIGSLALNYDGRYIGDFLVRSDGSSLFGPEARWNEYYRASVSWMMGREDWWPVDFLTEFKPYVSRGTAGSRPDFDWRYETFSIGTVGPRKGQLGNRTLRPEHTTEMDFGLDMILADRASLELNYTRSTTEDQLIAMPMPSMAGFSSQWQNAGTVEARVYTAHLDMQMAQRPDFSWNMGVVADRSRSWLTEWERDCHIAPTPQQSDSPFYLCEGEDFGNMWGREFMTSPDDLAEDEFLDIDPAHHDQFQVNDDGYLVPVGNHSWQDGLAEDLWGTTVEIDGQSFDWGHPIQFRDGSGAPAFRQIGYAYPSFNLGWTNNFQWRGFRFFALLDWEYGGQAYNETRQWPARDDHAEEMVQAGKPEGQRKPLDYYQTLYDTNSTNSHYVESNSFAKVRELSVGYRFSGDQLARVLPASGLGMDGLSIELVGRNLLTITNYAGDDPEVAASGYGGATENPWDGFSYPQFRTFTISFEADF